MIYPAYKWGGVYSKSEVNTLLNDYIPKMGGGWVFSGDTFSRTVDNDGLTFNGGTSVQNGASLQLYGVNRTGAEGSIIINLTLRSYEKPCILTPWVLGLGTVKPYN